MNIGKASLKVFTLFACLKLDSVGVAMKTVLMGATIKAKKFDSSHSLAAKKVWASTKVAISSVRFMKTKNFVDRLREIITTATNSEIIASLNYAFIKEIRLLRWDNVQHIKRTTDKDAAEKKRQKLRSIWIHAKESREEKFRLFSDAGANKKASQNSSDLNKTYCDMFSSPALYTALRRYAKQKWLRFFNCSELQERWKMQKYKRKICANNVKPFLK